ncbi:MAG: hypothetical protein ACI9XZ_002580, partial [Alphaproteobacteria bacterium]
SSCPPAAVVLVLSLMASLYVFRETCGSPRTLQSVFVQVLGGHYHRSIQENQ